MMDPMRPYLCQVIMGPTTELPAGSTLTFLTIILVLHMSVFSRQTAEHLPHTGFFLSSLLSWKSPWCRKVGLIELIFILMLKTLGPCGLNKDPLSQTSVVKIDICI